MCEEKITDKVRAFVDEIIKVFYDNKFIEVNNYSELPSSVRIEINNLVKDLFNIDYYEAENRNLYPYINRA
jgi:hypothetical protein